MEFSDLLKPLNVHYDMNKNITYKEYNNSDGSYHREDGPALMSYRENGHPHIFEWFRNGIKHREDGPAIMECSPLGYVLKLIWYIDGKCHRDDGPAFISYHNDGSKYDETWCVNNWAHKEDGPARIVYNNDGEISHVRWYLLGEEYTQSDHERVMDLCRGITSRDHAIMNIRHESEFIRMKCREVLDG